MDTSITLPLASTPKLYVAVPVIVPPPYDGNFNSPFLFKTKALLLVLISCPLPIVNKSSVPTQVFTLGLLGGKLNEPNTVSLKEVPLIHFQLLLEYLP